MANIKMDSITVLNERQKQSFIKSCNKVLQNAAEIKKERSSVEMTDGINKMKLSPIKNAQDIKDENLEGTVNIFSQI